VADKARVGQRGKRAQRARSEPEASAVEGDWEFAVDRGGTFTDCIGSAPDGALHTAKILSSDTAPVEGIRLLLERAGAIPPGAPLPRCRVRLGTTLATNALLERRGTPTVLVANRGLGDLIEIGTQERPDLFDLDIRKPPPLHARVVEVDGRVGVGGEEVESFDEPSARASLAEARAAGIESAAVTLIHAYAHPEAEVRLRDLALELGFSHVVASHEIAREMGLLARGETATVDAYLTPLLRAYMTVLQSELPGSRLRFMQSSGGLTDVERFRGPYALLSGPAGGVVGAARVAALGGFDRALGFDMGGTSTDVSLIRDGGVDRGFETLIGGVRVKAPMMRIHTVAAGGGSLCRFDGFRLTVGPESAGADPGPLCYGRPGAGEMALTDANFHLGRVQPDRFPFSLRSDPVVQALRDLESKLGSAGFELGSDDIAAGFVEVANASMAQAIAQVSVARGVDPRGCALVGFGGAAGQHVCAIARELGIRTILLHPLAGVLSAHGIANAPLSWDGQRDAGRVALGPELPGPVSEHFAELERAARAALADEGAEPGAIRIERLLDLRYAGTETPLAVREPTTGDWKAAFAAEHAARFGYTRPGRNVEIVAVRLRGVAPPADSVASAGPAAPIGEAAVPLRREQVWFPGVGRVEAPVYAREELAPDQRIAGPALVLEDTSTIVLDPGFEAELRREGLLVVRDRGDAPVRAEIDLRSADPIRLEVFGNRFMSIAEQMGAVLRNTAVSTNIKERLDYSCAVFDGSGGLVANAPHIPVHLGAMAETVRVVRERFPDLEDGDVVLSNDPLAGGSHLPDVTCPPSSWPAGGIMPTSAESRPARCRPTRPAWRRRGSSSSPACWCDAAASTRSACEPRSRAPAIRREIRTTTWRTSKR
jgi:5-oxoprolinase (ATP-hydrolysing)